VVLVKQWKIPVVTEAALAPLQSDIAILSMEGDRARKPLLAEKYFEANPQISPTGKWMRVYI